MKLDRKNTIWRKKINLYFFILLFASVSAQDTLIKTPIYESFYSFKYKCPNYVAYKLYKGGGDCDRNQFYFNQDSVTKKTATKMDYYQSGFDMGHLANAEDFAYDCEKEKFTFTFYNCLPQYHNMNAGTWRKYETETRKLSQSDSLFIIVGGIFSPGYRLGNSFVFVPNYCYRIVQSLTTKKIIYCLIFTNFPSDNYTKETTIKSLEKQLKYKLPIKK